MDNKDGVQKRYVYSQIKKVWLSLCRVTESRKEVGSYDSVRICIRLIRVLTERVVVNDILHWISSLGSIGIQGRFEFVSPNVLHTCSPSPFEPLVKS